MSPAIMLISVDLPQPFGPNTDTMAFLGMFRSKFSYSGHPAKYLVSPRMVMCVPEGPGTNGGIGTSATTAALDNRMVLSPAPVDDAPLEDQEQNVERVAEDARGQDRGIHAFHVQYLLRVDDAMAEPIVGADEHLGDDHDHQRHRHRRAQSHERRLQALPDQDVLEDLPARRAHHLGRHHALL